MKCWWGWNRWPPVIELGLPTRQPMTGLPDRVTIWEVGARDGLQNESAVIPASVKIELINRLAAAGLPVVEATSFVRPEWVPQLADATEVMAQLPKDSGTRFPVLVPNLRGLEKARAAGATEIAVFASATESFARKNLNRTLENQMEMFGPVIEAAAEQGIPVRGYVSMCFGDPWEGSVDPQTVVDVCRQLMMAGCASLSLGDTIGVATPGQIKNIVSLLRTADVDVGAIGVHFHDTYGQALANTLAALESGVTTVDSSAGGLGGCPYAKSATGNLATEDLVWMLDGLGVTTGVDLAALVQTSAWLAEILGRSSPSRVVRAMIG
ncbi:MAG: hydroxymethylglutaryl-CoA lyase [Micrococcales bacterium]|nr:hydroxymethylglutaryl-CoA lyase [Micrococcales bacterium]